MIRTAQGQQIDRHGQGVDLHAGRLQALEQALASSGLPDSCHLSLPSEPPQSLIGRVELLESSLAQIIQIQVWACRVP